MPEWKGRSSICCKVLISKTSGAQVDPSFNVIPISTQPMVLYLVCFDKILRRQDSPFLQKNEPQSGLRTPVSGAVCNF